MDNPPAWQGHANGKLLLSAEYFVLDGAVAIGLPCKLGQTLKVFNSDGNGEVLSWNSYSYKQEIWFQAQFNLPDFSIINTTDQAISERLQNIFSALNVLQPGFLESKGGLNIETHLEFDRQWGLGTSSTLIYLLSQWADVDPYQLLEQTFGGSGYDIAAAGMDQPFYYRKGNPPEQWICPFNPPFKSQLYFVYLGKKQNSREGIQRYKSREKHKLRELLLEISKLSMNLPTVTDLFTFETIIQAHESMVSSIVGLPRIQSEFFRDYWGQVKSLGAWGGDFVLVTSDRSEGETRQYFNEKGCQVFFKYNDLILNKS